MGRRAGTRARETKRRWARGRRRTARGERPAEPWTEASTLPKCPVGLCTLLAGHREIHVPPADEFDGFRFFPRTEKEQYVTRWLIQNRDVGLSRLAEIIRDLYTESKRPR